MNYQPLQEKFFNLIKQANNILIVSHQKPDGDTLGANFALAHFLEDQGKNYYSFCLHPVPEQFKFLPLSYKLNNDAGFFNKDIDLLIVVDSGDLRYAGIDGLISNLKKDIKIINIDHHPTNDNFGHLNIVDSKASSTTEIFFYLFKEAGIKINIDMATPLLTGILTDTSNFSNPATTVEALNVSSQLLATGVSLNEILGNILKNQSISALKVWGEALSRLKMTESGLAVTFITQKDLDEGGIDEEAISGMSNFLNNLGGVKAAMVLKEEAPDRVRASLRTSRDDIDVSRLAKMFGGGGHKKAAGFSVKGKLEKLKDNNWQIV